MGKKNTASIIVYNAASDYVDYFNKANDPTDTSIDLDKSILKERLAVMIGESGLRTNKEISGLKDKAVEVAQGLPTNAQVKAAKKALSDAVKALPAKATIADFAAVQAVSDAIDAYDKVCATAHGVTLTTYETAVAQIVKQYNSQFAQAVTTVKKTDEAAVKAIIADIKAAKKPLTKLTNGNATVTYMDSLLTTLNGYLAEIKAAEVKAVEKAIAAIPVNVTEADKATVEAARSLYNAYVEKYTDLEALYDGTTVNFTANSNAVAAGSYAAGFAADDIAIAELTAAETVLGLNTVDTTVEKVESIKVTASSKAGKGYITVTWKAVGETDVIDGYQIYKSTKANKGFKKAFTTTKTSYKNTKGLKKGTKYYYKVRAYKVVDGVNVYSDWSNKAYRTAK